MIKAEKHAVKRTKLCPMCLVEPRSKTLHTCPYKEEVYADLGTMCACCVRCEHACGQDV